MRVLLLITVFCCSCSPASSGSDAGTSPDAGPMVDAGGMPDAAVAADGGHSGSGTVCTFNADCPSSERCECDEATGCFCFTGTRGTGVNGVDTCTSSNDCETALCVEGNGGAFYCSAPCTSVAQCAAALPLCVNVAFVGRVCVRSPDGGM